MTILTIADRQASVERKIETVGVCGAVYKFIVGEATSRPLSSTKFSCFLHGRHVYTIITWFFFD